MSRLPAPSTVVPQALCRLAMVAGPPSPSGVRLPLPAGVVSTPGGLTCRTVPPAATYSEPAAAETPHGAKATLVAGAGPGRMPPATVAMSPAARARPPVGRDCPAAAAGTSAAAATAAARTTARRAGRERARQGASVRIVIGPANLPAGSVSAHDGGIVPTQNECRITACPSQGKR